MSEAMCLTTAQRRTKASMFGVTDTKYKQLRIRRPVLYVAVYSVGDAPSEVDDFHWAFLVGPSHEEADSKGTLCSMEPRQAPEHRRPYGGEWYWLYNQPTVHLRRQRDLLARLKIAEVASMKILQRIMLRWSGKVNMRQHVEWMSVRWLKQVLKNLDEDEECLGRRIKSFDPVEAEGRRRAEAEEARRKALRLLATRDEQDQGDTESDDTENESDENESDENEIDENEIDENESDENIDTNRITEESAGDKRANARPEVVPSTTMHLAESVKSTSVSEGTTAAQEDEEGEEEDEEEDNEDEDQSESGSDEDGEEEDEGTQRP